MQRFRRLVAAIALAATATTAVAACGGGDNGDDSDAKTLKLWHYESENSAMGVGLEPRRSSCSRPSTRASRCTSRRKALRADPAERAA